MLENEDRSDFVVDDIDMEQVSALYLAEGFFARLVIFAFLGCCKSLSQRADAAGN